jgi:putative PIN family toxin of toxin-antitoxin system
VIRAVIDTNVLVSGLLSPSGNEALILLAINQGWIQPCLTEPILDEYAAVLVRPKFAFPSDAIAALINMLRSRGEMFQPAWQPRLLPIRQIPSFWHAPRLPELTSS